MKTITVRVGACFVHLAVCIVLGALIVLENRNDLNVSGIVNNVEMSELLHTLLQGLMTCSPVMRLDSHHPYGKMPLCSPRDFAVVHFCELGKYAATGVVRGGPYSVILHGRGRRDEGDDDGSLPGEHDR